MGKDDKNWLPGPVRSRLDALTPLPPGSLPSRPRPGRPHPDRQPRHGPSPVRARRLTAPDRRGRHRLRLFHPLDGPRPAGRRDHRDHRPRPRRGPTWPAAGGARPASPTSGSRSSTRRRSRRSRPAIRRWPARSTSPSSTRSSPSTGPTSRRSCRPARARCAGRRRQRPVERPRVGRAAAAADDANTAALRAFDAAVLGDPRFTATILPVGDGLLIAAWRG